MSSVLVMGGAGYIGSHMVRVLRRRGVDVVVGDNLSTGHRKAVGDAELVVVDVLDEAGLDALFAAHSFDAVMHFCALSLVGESVHKPLDYYRNNVAGTLNLVEAMLRHDVDRLVFSSTAAVYGNPQQDLIDEDHPKQPINPYGASKRMTERLLADAAMAYGLKSVALRYFNAAGASPDGDIGESHDPETHLIPNVLKAALDTGPELKVFGNDYPTPDGTCVRDYIHVDDLAEAHLAALEHMADHDGAQVFNLGNGQGFSVLEIIRAAEKVTGREIPFDIAERRPGDPAVLVASSDRAREQLGWVPKYTDVAEIIRTAWGWHKSQGY